MKLLKLALLFSFCCIAVVFGQDQVNFNGRSINSFETIEAKISNGKIYIGAFLYELRRGHPNCKINITDGDGIANMPENMAFILDVNFAKNYKFPIKPKDSVILSFTIIEDEARKKAHLQKLGKKKEAIDRKAVDPKSSEARLANITGQMKKLADQFKNKQITITEFQSKSESLMKQMENITQQVEKVDDKINPFLGEKELKDKTFYSLIFLDIPKTKEHIQSKGYIYIKSFTKTEFIAEFKGLQEGHCYDDAAETAKRKGMDCYGVTSSVLGNDILEESTLTGSVKLKIRDFKDERF